MKRMILLILALGLLAGNATLGIAQVLYSTAPGIQVDVLTFDGELPYLTVPMTSQNTGQRATLTFLSFGEANPLYICSEFDVGLGLGVNEVTFQLQYDDGYVVSGTGKILVNSYGGLGVPGFGDHSVIAHLTVKATNQPARTGPWPRVGDQLRGAGDLNGTRGEGAYRLVRR